MRTENVYSIYSIICPVLMEVIHVYLSSATTIEFIQQLAQRQQASSLLKLYVQYYRYITEEKLTSVTA